MTMRMLIDARHQEETRVAVVKGNRIEEFDFESAEHKQLKGNIYLAKVTRVEPSLQAAFVDYGGNRHGFLAFSEIHPDYYQIPKEDREALLREEAEHAAEEERLRAAEDARYEDSDEGEEGERREAADDHVSFVDEEHDAESGEHGEPGDEAAPPSPETGETANDENAADELRKKRQALRRRYKIQDVIRRRQVLLVQVVKEERGNKGAALTTYLSLAGRYCVLMPNTSHGGGISRKISNGADRKRLKAIMSDLNLPRTMGCIVRTAGLSRTKTEIKRDFDYLARLWDEIRENTLKAAAPALIHQDSDLIKRAIRDIYHREIEEIFVEGEEGYRAARAFMKLLMPSHVRRVKLYADTVPLFQRYGVEDQLAGMYQPVVQLKSGGYLVINPTEALVSIDINSGRSTREHNIEQTAYATNIEAAHEIARQLRLRDMAGLVVIDFIDMESNGHIRKVEKTMKDALKNDRARIQVGRISSFGLMEMSRQRLRTGVLEASTKPCPHCEGSGLMRTAASAGLSALRMIEEEAARGRGSRVVLRAGREAAIYVLNKKRHEIDEVEDRYGVIVEVLIDEGFEGAKMSVECFGPPPVQRPRIETLVVPAVDEEDLAEEFDEQDEEEEEPEEEEQPVRQERRPERPREGAGDSESERGRKRRRRRGRRGGRRQDGREEGDARPLEESESEDRPDADEEGAEESVIAETAASEEASAEAPAAPPEAQAPAEDEQPAKPRRRPRARRKSGADVPAEAAPETPAKTDAEAPAPEAAEAPAPEAVVADAQPLDAAANAPEPPAKPKRTRRKKVVPTDEPAAEAPAAAETAAPADESAPPQAANDQAANDQAGNDVPASASASADESPRSPEAPVLERQEGTGEPVTTAEDADAGPPRRGWWQRTFGG